MNLETTTLAAVFFLSGILAILIGFAMGRSTVSRSEPLNYVNKTRPYTEDDGRDPYEDARMDSYDMEERKDTIL